MSNFLYIQIQLLQSYKIDSVKPHRFINYKRMNQLQQIPLTQVKNLMKQEIRLNNLAIFIHIKNIQRHPVSSNSSKLLVHEAISLMKKQGNLQILCFFTYQQKQVLASTFQTMSNVQKLLKEKKKQGITLSQIHIQYLCLFKRQAFQFVQIVQKYIECRNQVLKDNKQQQIDRGLTIIPSHAIMKDGKRYNWAYKKNINQVVNQQIKLSVKLNQERPKQNTKKTKAVKTQLLRMNASKVRPNQEEENKSNVLRKNTKKQQNLSQKLPNIKLKLQQDSQSQDYYRPEKYVSNLDKDQMKDKNTLMQVENHGNYMQNMVPYKMQIEDNGQDKNDAVKTKQKDSDDQMDNLFQQMKEIQVLKSKQQSATSLPPIQDQKVSGFANKQPSKVVASKQKTLFNFYAKN